MDGKREKEREREERKRKKKMKEESILVFHHYSSLHSYLVFISPNMYVDLKEGVVGEI